MAKLVKIWFDSNLAKRFVKAKISEFEDPALAPARTFTEYYWKSVLQYL